MEPYADTLDHLEDELRRLDLLLRRHLESWWNDHGGSATEMRGLFVSDDEVAALLSVPGRNGRRVAEAAADHRDRQPGPSNSRGRADADETDRTDRSGEPDPELARLLEARESDIFSRKAATSRTDVALRLPILTDRFGLEPRHVDALLVALAPELDRKYEKIYGYLQDDVTRTRPTVGLVFDVLGCTEIDRLAARTAFARTSPLVRNRLVRLGGDENAPFHSRTVAVEPRVVAFLLGNDDVVGELAHVVDVRSPEATLDELLVDDEVAARLRTVVHAHEGRPGANDQSAVTAPDSRPESGFGTGSAPGPRMTYLHGPAGVGKATAVDAIAAASGASVVRTDASTIVGADLTETIRLLEREVALQDAALHVANIESLQDHDVDPGRFVRRLDDFEGDVFLTGVDRPPADFPGLIETHHIAAVHLPMPSYELRRQRWTEVPDLPSDVDPDALAATFRLTGGQIADAVSIAETEAGDSELDAKAIQEGCRSQTTTELGTLARKLDPGYTWEDIVLPPETMTQLRDVAAHITNQGRVYDDWGFAEKFSHGNGLTVLFTGPSGTGKTMAAEIIAGEAGFDLYKIDLANVVSKYIGETEKNLGRIFDEAEDSNAILFFDEADALFGQRSEVRDAHDRYANIEVNYLLQRVEEHAGLVILTTNFDQNIDDAFLRRIHVSIDFPFPDQQSRAAIWRNVFPEETPLGDLDYEFLSTFEISGGSIRNIALTAAFLAADGDGSVDMEHLVRAAKREFEKTGKLLEPDQFGEYDVG